MKNIKRKVTKYEPTLIGKIKWFTEESKSYMAGYSKLYFWLHYPKALIKFLWSMRKN